MPSSSRAVGFNWITNLGLFFIASSIVSEMNACIKIDTRAMGNVDWPYEIYVKGTNRGNIYLQNQKIGTIVLLCPHGNCDIVQPDTNLKCPNMNGPTIIRQGSIYHLFVSGHTGGTTIRRFEASSLEGPWHEAILKLPSLDKCAAGLHSPDVVLFHGKYYMYAHLHSCQDVKGKQATIVLTSTDLAHWELPRKTAYAAKEYFYTRVFLHNNIFYAIAKSQENPVGSMVLLSSDSPLGPFQYVKTFVEGVRNVSLHQKGDRLFVFYSLIGDLPERILLGVIHLNAVAEWRLRPGPIILEPLHDGDLVPSEAGPAPCAAVPQLRDPFFVPDSNEGESELRGILFFTVRGELAIGAARLQINLAQFWDATRYHNHTNIDDLVFRSSSLSAHPNAFQRPLLITGVGRSGTTFVCSYLNQLGWNISHDNDRDCGPFPGTYGASSWYHAFQTTQDTSNQSHPMRADMVVHLVRNPLATIKSRIARGKAMPHSLNLTYRLASIWEDIDPRALDDDTTIATFMLRHWVHRNTFASRHAQWRVTIEDLAMYPLHTWMLCLSVGRDDCPALGAIRPVLQSMNHSTNTNGKLEGSQVPEDDITWWRQLAKVDGDGVRIALKMASEYGYQLDDRLEDVFQFSMVKYSCQFANDKAARLGDEMPRQWGCHLATL
ncbi:hypothetical protein MHU86_23015 [Fragilaria crotonensis]|nr:hypothetical protein MHU86_23015 [Fragilaria crotonensis]